MSRPLCELRVLSMAHAMALRAKCGVLRREEVAALDGALTDLPEDDPVRQPMARFVASARVNGRQPQALALAGADLQQAVRRALWPVESGRSDIHG